MKRSRSIGKATPKSQPAVEATGQVKPPLTEAGPEPLVAPLVEPEEIAETPVHPQEQNVGIPYQKVTSTFVRPGYFLLLMFLPLTNLN